MISEKRRKYLLWLWENERTEEDEEWRDDLTEEEQELVDSWDAGYAAGVARLVEKRERGWKLYIETRNGVPTAYRYGPEWQASALWVDGGYPTPEEAKAAWYRELEEHPEWLK